MKKLLIIQNYNANKGDSSVIHTMKKTLGELAGDIDISLTSYDPLMAEKEYGLESSEWIISFRKIKLSNSFISKLYYFVIEFIWIVYSLIWLLFFKVKVRLAVPQRKRSTIHHYVNSEVVVLPGGHFFTNLNGFPVNISHAYGLLYAKWLGKKTMIYSQTVGPFFGKLGPITRIISSYVVRNTDIVTIRESGSKQYFADYPNVHITAETVFALPTNMELADNLLQLNELRLEDKLIVGVTIHHIYYKHYFSKYDYVALMSSLFDKIIEKYNCIILIIPMEAGYHGGGDRPIAKEMRDKAKNPKMIHILNGELDPLATSSVIGNTDIFIGTKTHSIVYGLKSIIPTISISYHQKSTEFMKMFDVGENAINLNNLSVEEFMSIFERVIKNRENYSKIEQSAYSRVKELSMKNNTYLLSLFSGA